MSSVSDLSPPQDVQAAVGGIAGRYLWWEPIDGGRRGFERSFAQIMDIGTYEDILRLEALIDAGRLAAVMLNAAPGWFSDRSWEMAARRGARIAGGCSPARPRAIGLIAA